MQKSPKLFRCRRRREEREENQRCTLTGNFVSIGSQLVLIKEGSKGNQTSSLINQGAELDIKPASLGSCSIPRPPKGPPHSPSLGPNPQSMQEESVTSYQPELPRGRNKNSMGNSPAEQMPSRSQMVWGGGPFTLRHMQQEPRRGLQRGRVQSGERIRLAKDHGPNTSP